MSTSQSTRARKKTGKKKGVRAHVLWRQVLLDYFNKDRSLYGPTRNFNFYADAQAMYSGRDRISYLYTLDGYGTSIPVSFASNIRRMALGDVRVEFISLLEPHRIEWNSARVKSKFRTWKNLQDEQGEVNDFNLHENILSMDTTAFRSRSLQYLSDADIRRGRALFKNRTLMIISGTRGEDFDKSVKNILDICSSQLSLKMTRVNRELPRYLEAFSPFKMEGDNGIFSDVGNTVMPDETIARFRSFDQGRVGDSGKYWGTDIFSRFPVFKKTKEDAVDAENWLIIAETGGGKSYLCKTLLLQFAGDDQYNITILDIEGDEYIPLAHFVANNSDVVILNMGEGRGSYFDPVPIPMTGNAEIDEGMFEMSKSFTIALLQTLIGSKVMGSEASSVWPRKIINSAVERVYREAGVTTDPATWERSAHLSIHEVYRIIQDLYKEAQTYQFQGDHSTAFRGNEEYRKSFDVVVASLEDYLSPNGTRAYVFGDRVTTEEVTEAKMVLCSFGMKGKSQSMVDEIQMGLTQLYAGMLSSIRSNFSKAQGRFNVKVFEEFQRYSGLPDADKVFKVAITGGRKLGDVNVVITNQPSELLSSDKFGVFENTTSFAIGGVADEKMRAELCSRLSVENMKTELDRIALSMQKKTVNLDKSGSSDGGSQGGSHYRRSFLVRLDRRDTTITKVRLPEHIAMSPLFRTGPEVKEESK